MFKQKKGLNYAYSTLYYYIYMICYGNIEYLNRDTTPPVSAYKSFCVLLIIEKYPQVSCRDFVDHRITMQNQYVLGV